MTGSRTAGHFHRLYQANPDPWSFASSPYEQAKYQTTLAALGDRRFASGLEVGCSIGILTRMLAPRCDRLLGIDIVEAPLAAARARNASMPHVRFARMTVPADWPGQSFDLIVLSEVLYFLSRTDLDRCADRVAASLLPRSVLILVNWLGSAGDPNTGEEAAEYFISRLPGRVRPVQHQRHPGYRLDVLTPD